MDFIVKTTRPCDKLDHKRLGPFKIVAKINNNAFELDMPRFNGHKVLHVSLFEPTSEAYRKRFSLQNLPSSVIVDDTEEFHVERILDSRLHLSKMQYLVKWLGYPVSENSWEPAENLRNASKLVRAFHRSYPDKPGF